MTYTIKTTYFKNNEYNLDDYAETLQKLVDLSQKWAKDGSSYHTTLLDNGREYDNILFEGIIGAYRLFSEDMVLNFQKLGTSDKKACDMSKFNLNAGERRLIEQIDRLLEVACALGQNISIELGDTTPSIEKALEILAKEEYHDVYKRVGSQFRSRIVSISAIASTHEKRYEIIRITKPSRKTSTMDLSDIADQWNAIL